MLQFLYSKFRLTAFPLDEDRKKIGYRQQAGWHIDVVRN